jgi:Uma2 family endonuclease
MSALAKPSNFVTPEQYLALERAAEERSEYFNGVIVAMAGSTSNHALIVGNIYVNLHLQLRDRPCRVYGSDMKVRIERANSFRYPDLSALCGPVAFHDATQDAYLNPSFLCEVLSPSTEAYDRGDKFALYRLLDSFVEYLVVAQDRRWAQLHRRAKDGGWECLEFTEPDDQIALASIGCTLRLGDLYEKVEF